MTAPAKPSANAFYANVLPVNKLLSYLHDHQITINPDFRREALRLTLQALMEWEVSSTINAGHYERVDERKTYRNGYRPRVWRSTVGEIPLYIPRLRQGTYTPDFLRVTEASILDLADQLFVSDNEIQPQAIQALCQQAGLLPMHLSEYHTLMDTLTITARRARQHRITNRFTALWLDTVATDSHKEIKIAVGANESNRPELLAFGMEARTTWHDVLGDLVERGLRNVDTVLAAPQVDARSAVRVYLPRVDWQISAVSSLPRAQLMPLAQSGMWVDDDLFGGIFDLPPLAVGLAVPEHELYQMQAIAVAIA